ncbi:MAG TPA: tRNA (adenosine(37)-N6)-dimethylallyltransferase MiaA [Acidimicrobiia bacterium]|nr:tRNA (adenosine(37)-N6)-dimethylallyltransferase MiaA [Acidimicrobiia bacterium]
MTRCLASRSPRAEAGAPTVQHLALVGPTASGKSAVAVEVAQALGDIEIVSLDSMQVYRGLDIGTAKPDRRARAGVPHHLIDVVDADADWSVARTQTDARATVADIEARGRRALLVGGTGLYVQAVVDDFHLPGEDLALRAELAARIEQPGGIAAAYQDLVTRDPVAATRIDPHNARRIVRALEVIALTGAPFSSFGDGVATYGTPSFPIAIAGLWLPRPVLARRIATRVEAMRQAGFTDEVRTVLATPGLSRTARQAIGYHELAETLEQGAEPDDATYDTITRRTRSLARRQRMWFRRDPRITWHATTDNPCRIVPTLLATWTP